MKHYHLLFVLGALLSGGQFAAHAEPVPPNTDLPIRSRWPQSPVPKWIAPSVDQSVGNAAVKYRDLTGYNPAKLKRKPQLTTVSNNKVPRVTPNGAVTSLTPITSDAGEPAALPSELNVTDSGEPFQLNLELQPTSLVLNWSTAFGCCDVESTTDLESGPWTTIPDAPSIVNGRFTLSLPRGEESMRFFRLKQRPPGPIGPVVLVNEQYGGLGIMEYVTFDHPTCDIGTGCALVYPLDGTIDNYFDASETVYDSQCSISDGPVEYHWRFRYPPTIQSGKFYTNPAITGTDTSHVTFPPNAMPALSGVDVGWRVILTITKNTPNGVVTRETLFRFQYDSSELQCCP